jgi:nucleotide-binding universal stress UspA family protein
MRRGSVLWKEVRADPIVMGQVGHSGPRRILIGSWPGACSITRPTLLVK